MNTTELRNEILEFIDSNVMKVETVKNHLKNESSGSIFSIAEESDTIDVDLLENFDFATREDTELLEEYYICKATDCYGEEFYEHQSMFDHIRELHVTETATSPFEDLIDSLPSELLPERKLIDLFTKFVTMKGQEYSFVQFLELNLHLNHPAHTEISLYITETEN